MELFSTKAYKTVPWIWQPIQTINHPLDRIKVPQWMEWVAAQTGDRLSQIDTSTIKGGLKMSLMKMLCSVW